MDGGLFENVLNKVQDFLKEKRIVIASEQTLMQALPLVIECVEIMKNKGVTGIEKRNLVLKVILFIVNQSKIDEDKKNILRGFIEGGTLETTIDIIVDASKGKLELNRKTKRKLFACMKQCYEDYSLHRAQPEPEPEPEPESELEPELEYELESEPELEPELEPEVSDPSVGEEDEPLPVFDDPEPEKVTDSTMV